MSHSAAAVNYTTAVKPKGYKYRKSIPYTSSDVLQAFWRYKIAFFFAITQRKTVGFRPILHLPILLFGRAALKAILGEKGGVEIKLNLHWLLRVSSSRQIWICRN